MKPNFSMGLNVQLPVLFEHMNGVGARRRSHPEAEDARVLERVNVNVSALSA